MDTSVALVKAYPQINGNFCVKEYSLMETAKGGKVRTLSDLDMHAFRFPHAGGEISVRKWHKLVGEARFQLDTGLGAPRVRADMIIGEVKRGQARFSPTARKPKVLVGALMRFGCCNPLQSKDLAYDLHQHTHSESEYGHRIRMVAFGGADDNEDSGVSLSKWRIIYIKKIARCLRRHLHDNRNVLRRVPFATCSPFWSVSRTRRKSAS